VSVEEEAEIKISGALYSAASDAVSETKCSSSLDPALSNLMISQTAAALSTTILLVMAIHPDVFQKAQSDVDQVVGQGRLPGLCDRLSLPYLDKILNELYRWNPLPLAFLRSRWRIMNVKAKGTIILSGPNICRLE